MDYRAPGWLLGGRDGGGDDRLAGHLQTIWPVLFSRRHDGPAPRWRRERWTTPDGDFIDVDFSLAHDLDGPTPAEAGRPLLVLFHGLEGSSESHYAVSFADVARRRGWAYAVPHFRGCSGEPNLAPRAYHSGDHEEIGWILGRFRARAALQGRPLLAVGISLGGNALLRWAEEAGDGASSIAQAVAAVCSPIDLAAGGRAMGRGFNRWVYTPRFLRTMKPRALHKWQQHPGLFDRDRLRAARTLYEFDDVFTAPLHGFRGTDDYWHLASAKPHLHRIRVPALVLNARNDPFVPASSLPAREDVGPCVTLWHPQDGGHVGFPEGRPAGHVLGLPERVTGWLVTAAGALPGQGGVAGG
jgi:predicted alpha/beta-fold hydrolase